MSVRWSGYISPIADPWIDIVSQGLAQSMPLSLGDVTVSIDGSAVSSLGVQTLIVTADGKVDLSTAQQAITNTVINSGSVNLDPSSVQVASGPTISPITNRVIGGRPSPVRAGGGTIVTPIGDDSGNITGMIIPPDTVPATDPIPVVLTPPDSGPIPFTDQTKDIKPPDSITATSPNIYGPRTTTVIPGSPVVTTSPDRPLVPVADQPPIVPVVVTTTQVNPPLPTLPAPLVPVTPTNNPYYVPGVVAPIATPAIQPPSPDPTSNIVNGTPIQTPNLPKPSTSVALNVPQQSSGISPALVVVGIIALLFLSSK